MGNSRVFWCVAILVIFSFLLHGFIDHDHPRELFGEGLQATLHGDARKWWTFFVLGLLVFSNPFAQLRKQVSLADQRKIIHAILREQDTIRPLDALLQAFRRGLIHPKLCGSYR